MKRILCGVLALVLSLTLAGCEGDINDKVEVSDVEGLLTGGIQFTLTNTTNETIRGIIVIVQHLSTTKGEYTEEIEISALPPNTPKQFKTREHGDSISSDIIEVRKE
jgi:hypothetical protein